MTQLLHRLFPHCDRTDSQLLVKVTQPNTSILCWIVGREPQVFTLLSPLLARYNII